MEIYILYKQQPKERWNGNIGQKKTLKTDTRDKIEYSIMIKASINPSRKILNMHASNKRLKIH